MSTGAHPCRGWSMAFMTQTRLSSELVPPTLCSYTEMTSSFPSIIIALPVLLMDNREALAEWPENTFVGGLVETSLKGFGPCGLLNDNWFLAVTISTKIAPSKHGRPNCLSEMSRAGKDLLHTDYSMRLGLHSYVTTWRNHKPPLLPLFLAL